MTGVCYLLLSFRSFVGSSGCYRMSVNLDDEMRSMEKHMCYIYIYIYTYIHTYIHTYTYIYIYIYIHTYIQNSHPAAPDSGPMKRLEEEEEEKQQKGHKPR